MAYDVEMEDIDVIRNWFALMVFEGPEYRIFLSFATV